MGLQEISEAIKVMACVTHVFSEAEKEFILQFACKTGDKELTNKLIDELMSGDRDRESVFKKYQIMVDFRPDWINRIENLLVALEMYRQEEEKAVRHLLDILSAYHIEVSEEELREPNLDIVKERIKREADLREVNGACQRK